MRFKHDYKDYVHELSSIAFGKNLIDLKLRQPLANYNAVLGQVTELDSML